MAETVTKSHDSKTDTNMTLSSNQSIKEGQNVVVSSALPEFSNSEIHIDPELERQTLAKFDKFLLPQFAIILLVAYLDRSNIGNAKIFGFESGIGLEGTQFNNISTVFYATYITFETPFTMAIKYFGANSVLGFAMVCWSITTICTGFIQNYHQAIAVRVLLGFFESGLVPGIVFIMSTVWSRESQSKRVALIYGCNALSGAFGGLIAWGIQSMGARRGLAPWRWLFIVEGSISLFLCGLCWLSLPKTAETAWFLNEAEKEVMRLRKERDIVTRGSEKFEWKYARMAFTDPFVYLAATCFFCSSVAIFGFGTFLPTIINGLGYTALQANYLTIPVYLLACITLVTGTVVSDRIKKRSYVLGIAPIPVIIGYIIVASTPSVAAGYFAMFLCSAGIYTYNCILLTWVSNNLSPDYKRSAGVPFFASLGNISGVVASNIYPANGGPRYVMGNAISAGAETIAWLLIGAIWWLLRWREAKKDALREMGVQDNGKEGDRRLDFKYNL